MKSGVRMNFLERRLYADRALTQLVRMARAAAPDTLSSREQRGVFRLEAMLVEKSGTALSARPWIGSNFAARWAAFSTIVLTVVYGFWQKGHAHRERARAALWRALAWSRRLLAQGLMVLRSGVYRAARLRDLRTRERPPQRRPRDPGSIWLDP